MAAAPMPARFDMGRVISRTFSASAANFLSFYVVGLVLAGGPLLLMQWSQLALGENALSGNYDPAAVFGPSYFIGLALYLLGSAVASAAFTHGAFLHFNGQRASLGGLAETGLRFLPVSIAIAILAYLGVILGFILLIVPGIILALMWTVAIPAAVVDRIGPFAALGRSRRLTANHRWAILGLVLLAAIVSTIVSAFAQVIGAALAASMGSNAIAGLMVSGAVIQPVAVIISAVGVCAIYFELRVAKEGIGPEQLASVFD